MAWLSGPIACPDTTTPRSKADVSDFIWCLEEAVDTEEHEQDFGAIPTSTDVRDWAIEPGEHDDEDIRRTWKQNLGT